MQGHKILFVMFLVFGLIGAIRDFGPVSPGDLFFMHVNVNNEGTKDLDDLRVRIIIYDLATIFQSSSFDLNDGDTAGKILFWDVPSYVQPGNYWARITVSNDEIREVTHRIITII